MIGDEQPQLKSTKEAKADMLIADRYICLKVEFEDIDDIKTSTAGSSVRSGKDSPANRDSE